MSFDNLMSSLNTSLVITSKLVSMQNSGDFNELYRANKALGSGTFGQVRSCTHIPTEQQRAFKFIPAPKVQPGRVLNDTTEFDKKKKMLIREAEILAELNHPSILLLFEFFDTVEGLYVVTDIYEGGDLFTEITRIGRDMKFTKREVKIVLEQLLSAISYLHGCKVVHRDIKPENIMLEKAGDLNHIKLIDLGHAVHFDPRLPFSKAAKTFDRWETELDGNPAGETVMTEKVGTPYYVAPEVLRRSYNHKCDIWSIGVIAYILVTGKPPFNGKNNDEIFKNIAVGKHKLHKYVKKKSLTAKLIDGMLTHDYQHRPSAKRLLKKLKKSRTFQTQKTVEEEELQNEAILNLKRFNNSCKLKQVVHVYLVSQFLTKEKRQELETAFKAFDVDGDGTLSKYEFRKFFKDYLGDFYDRKQADALFKRVDTDGSGNIDFQEFILATTDADLLANTERMDLVFDFLDKDGSGDLDAEELREVFKNDDSVLTEDIEKMIAEVDQNGDGLVSKQEFLNMFYLLEEFNFDDNESLA